MSDGKSQLLLRQQIPDLLKVNIVMPHLKEKYLVH